MRMGKKNLKTFQNKETNPKKTTKKIYVFFFVFSKIDLFNKFFLNTVYINFL